MDSHVSVLFLVLPLVPGPPGPHPVIRDFGHWRLGWISLLFVFSQYLPKAGPRSSLPDATSPFGRGLAVFWSEDPEVRDLFVLPPG